MMYARTVMLFDILLIRTLLPACKDLGEWGYLKVRA